MIFRADTKGFILDIPKYFFPFYFLLLILEAYSIFSPRAS
jgi:hypothetical protein